VIINAASLRSIKKIIGQWTSKAGILDPDFEISVSG
jgi:hypothetical protein